MGDRQNSQKLSFEQEVYAAAGDRERFWFSRLLAGDPLAKTALGIVKGNAIMGISANNFLNIGIIISRSRLSLRDVLDINQAIGVQLMRAHLIAVRNDPLSSPSVEQIRHYHYHYQVFSDNSIPTWLYGGTPLFITDPGILMHSIVLIVID